jgi:hypothetical protein
MVVLVFVGQLAKSQRAKVHDAFTQVLRWDQDGFWDDLRALLGNLVSTLGAQVESRLLHELRDDVRDLRSYQAEDRELLAKLAHLAQDEHRLRIMIREETHRAYLRSPNNAEALNFGEEYPGIQRDFDGAVSAIREALALAERHWRSIFEPEEPTRGIDRSSAPGNRRSVPSDLTQDPVIRAMGVLASLDYSLDGFGRAIAGFLALKTEERPPRHWLGHQCGRFDQSVEDLITLIPSLDEDSNHTVHRVLGVVRGDISSRVQGFGAFVYDEIYDADFNKL